MQHQPTATRAKGMTTTTHHHQHATNPAFDNRRSRCISVPNAGWKVSMTRPSNNDPSSSSSRQPAATVNTASYGSYPPFYHDNGPKVSSNDAFHMRKNHRRMMQHHHQQRPASFVGGFVVPPPLLQHSHAPLVPPPQAQPSLSSSSTTQLYQSSMTPPSNDPTTTIAITKSHHSRPRNIPPPPSSSKQRPSLDSTNKQPRRIRVQSVNEMHRVWIDVAPNETGYTLADKIHTIATFRTMKLISITTARGRPIPLTKQPVFTSWDDLQGFEDGEEWKVEWVPLERRNLVDRIMSRVVQS